MSYRHTLRVPAPLFSDLPARIRERMIRNSVMVTPVATHLQTRYMTALDEWCIEHCSGLYQINLKTNRVMFELEDDRMLFQTARPGDDMNGQR